jgi:hypothetical protein
MLSSVFIPVGGYARLTAIGVPTPSTFVFDAVIRNARGVLVSWQGSVDTVTTCVAGVVDLPIVPGELVSSRASIVGLVPSPGYTAVRMDIYAGDPALGVRITTVVHGCLCFGQLEGLPLRTPDGGLCRSPGPTLIAITDPAAGAGAIYTLAGWQASRLHAVRWKLVNDANIAVRTVFLILKPIAGRDIYFDSLQTSTAGQTSLGAFVAGISVAGLHALKPCDPLPLCPLLLGGVVGIYVSNMQATDQLSELGLVADFDWLI